MSIKRFAAIAFAACALAACDDNTDVLGSSLIGDGDHLTVAADTFNISTSSFVADSVLSRSTIGYLGRIRDPETGATITGDFMTQFHMQENFQFPPIDSIVSKMGGQVVADSCEIRLFFNQFYGDSTIAMKLTAYEMDKPLEEGVQYYSNYNPQKEGYLRTAGLTLPHGYALMDINEKDSLRKSKGYVPSIRLLLNDPYTDKNGVTYNNFGTYLMRTYYAHPAYFKNSYNFIHHVAPGFFFKWSYGEGAMAYVNLSQLTVHFREIVKGKPVKVMVSFAGTEEVLQTTTVTNDKNTIRTLATDNTCTYLKTPAGIFTEMTLPITGIVTGHENDSINAAKVVLHRINNTIHSPYTLEPPKTLLMIPRDSLYSFFENGRVTDYRTSFISTYGKPTANAYTFSNISGLITHLNSMKTAGGTGWTASHPNWNKVVLIPVTVTTNSTGTITRVVHDMSMKSTKLAGGTGNPHAPLEISVIYSKFK